MEALLSSPSDALERVQRLFLTANLAMLAVSGGMLLSTERSPEWLLALAAVALPVLGAVRLRQYRVGGPSILLDAVEIPALIAIALATGPTKALGIFYLGVYFRSLYGGAPRVALGLALYVAAMFIGFLTPEPLGESAVPVALSQPVGFAISAAVAQVLGRAMRFQRRALAREAALRYAGTELVAAADVHSRCRAVLGCAEALAFEAPGARVAVVLGSVEGMRVEAGPVAGHPAEPGAVVRFDAGTRRRLEGGHAVELGLNRRLALGIPENLWPEGRSTMLAVPLMVRGTVGGALLVTSEARLSDETRGALGTLAAGGGLALESAADIESKGRRLVEERFERLVDRAHDIVWIVTAHGVVSHVSAAVRRSLGYEPDELVGTALIELVHPAERARVLASFRKVLERPGVSDERIEVRWQHRDGSWRRFENTRTNLSEEPSVGGVILNSRDVTDRHALEAQLKHQAFHDPLTSLANRALFHDRVEHALASRAADPLWVLFLDLDDFKRVNDSLGHSAGDRLLVETAHRLRRCVRPGDTAARLAGDEFAVLLEGSRTRAEVEAVAERVSAAVSEPFELDGRRVRTSVSVGVAGNADGTPSAEDLLRDADLAMYAAKSRGKARHEVFAAPMHEAALRRLELEGDLRGAVEAGQIEVIYQPVVELRTGRIVALEALARWRHPELGVLAPLEWIGLAEESELILPIGRLMLEEACRTLVDLRARTGHTQLRLAVNLSGVQLADAGLVTEVRRTLDAFAVDPAGFILEVTESVAMHDAEVAIARLAELRGLGVSIAMDDFGVGYSSLDHLRRFPVDIVKIDKSFIRGVEHGSRPAAFARAIIELGRVMELDIVAEGIEHRAELDELRALGCDLGQGFLFSRPLPAEEARLLLEAHLLDARLATSAR